MVEVVGVELAVGGDDVADDLRALAAGEAAEVLEDELVVGGADVHVDGVLVVHVAEGGADELVDLVVVGIAEVEGGDPGADGGGERRVVVEEDHAAPRVGGVEEEAAEGAERAGVVEVAGEVDEEDDAGGVMDGQPGHGGRGVCGVGDGEGLGRERRREAVDGVPLPEVGAELRGAVADERDGLGLLVGDDVDGGVAGADEGAEAGGGSHLDTVP